MSVDISVIVPVYNTEAYLERCLDSIVGQTHQNIEVIVVNDASLGRCEEIVSRYEKQDNRVRCISYSVNKGLMQARITGALDAKGKYVLYVDSDDSISKYTCEKTYKKAEKYQADIVRYGMFYGKSIHEMRPHFVNASATVLRKESIIKNFLEGKIWWTICGKLFNRHTLLDGLNLAEIPEDIHINQAEDFALFFPVICLAQIYVIDLECGKYFYFDISDSLTKNHFVSDERWRKICMDLKSVRNLVLDVAVKKISQNNIVKLEKFMLNISMWYTEEIKKGAIHNKGQYYAQLLNAINQGIAIEVMGKECLEIICQSAPFIRNVIPPLKKNISHIAIFCYSLRFGGAERIANLLADMFSVDGFQVTLFTDEEPSDADYDYNSKNIKRIILNSERSKRWTELQLYCEKLSIDLCIFNSHWLPQNMYDMLAVQYTGVRNIIIEHNVYFFPLYQNAPELFSLRKAAYQNADAIICLSESHAAFWNSAGYDKAIYIQNQLTFNRNLCKRSLGKSLDILFVGRIGATKGALELLRVFKIVLESEPEARLVLVGRFENIFMENEFKQLAEELNVSKKIISPGHVQDVSSWYEEAKVHVMPSKFEGAPMVLMEAKAHGVPSVVFEMKYLGSATENDGCIMVGKNDVPGMAKAVLSLMQDHEKWLEMSNKAFSSLDCFSTEIILDKWKKLIRSIEQQSHTDIVRENRFSGDALASLIMTEFNCAIEYLDASQKSNLSFPRYLQLIKIIVDRLLPYGSYRRSLARKFARKIYNFLILLKHKI